MATGLIRLNEVWDASLAPLVSNNSSVVPRGSSSYLVEDYLEEGKSLQEIDGRIILGKIKGPSFFGDGVSRNQRFYPRALWEKQLSNPRIQERLRDRVMLGQIGHQDGPVTETDIASGMISHIVSNLTLQEDNQGISELLILNTQAGRNLYNLMKAGSRLKISTRAQGRFLEGETHNGLPIVDPDSFILETLDIVINPGFIEVDPRLQESLERKISDRLGILESGKPKKTSSTGITLQENRNNVKENFIMDLSEKLLDEARNSSKVYETLYHEQRKLREEAEEDKKEAEKECEECKKELEEAYRQLAKYQMLGEAEDIARELQEYAELGFTSPTEARFVLESLREEAEDAISAEDAEDIKDDLKEAAMVLAQYEELGTPEELKDIKDKAGELADELDKKEKNECIARLCHAYGLSEGFVRPIVEESEDEEEAEEKVEEALEGMADPDIDDTKSGTDVEDYENGYETPNSVNDNDVEAEPNVVEEALNDLLANSTNRANTSLLEGYKPGSIVSNMFKN